jgi:hypothetical protein
MNWNTENQKLRKLTEGILFNESIIDFLKLNNISRSVNNSSEKFIISPVVHNPVLFDLYNFQGLTYTNDESGAVPPQYYDVNEENTAWTFNLPIWGYRVSDGVNPETLLGVGPWEYLTSISIIKTKIHYLNLPEIYVQKAKVISYLYTDDNLAIPSFEVLVDPINDIYLDFSTFYRWVQVTDGYELEFYSFLPVIEGMDVKLDTTIYFLSKDLGNENQSYTIKK